MQYKKQETKEKILSCALEEFYVHGENNASIRRIAEGADVAVGNIYNYFDSKRAIFEELISPVAKSVSEHFDRLLASGISMKVFDEFKKTTIPFMVRNRREIKLLMNTQNEEGTKFKQQFFEKFSERLKKEIDRIRSHVKKVPISKEYSLALSKSFLNGAFEILFSSDDSRSVSAMLTDYFQFFFSGLDKRI